MTERRSMGPDHDGVRPVEAAAVVDESRRRFLRAAAATTAVVWVAPAVTNVGSASAFAAVSPVPPEEPTEPTEPTEPSEPPVEPPTQPPTQPPGGEVIERPEQPVPPPGGEVIERPGQPVPPPGGDTEVEGVVIERPAPPAARGPRAGAPGRPGGRDAGADVLAVHREGGELPRTGADATRLAALGAIAAAGGAAMVRQGRRTGSPTSESPEE